MDEAYRLLGEALRITQIMKSPYLSWRIHYALGKLYSRDNESQKALDQYTVVRDLYEETVSKLSDQSLKNSLLSNSIYQDVCARLSDTL
jgi:hypothetical protein